MGYRLGIDLGTTYTAAAFIEDADPRMLELGYRQVSMPSVMLVNPDGTLLIGEAAERRAAAEPDRVIREFKRRFGDDVPLLVAGHAFSAIDLQAALLRWILAHAEQRLAPVREHAVVTHPADWGPYKMRCMRSLLAAAGIAEATLCAEPVAAAIEFAARRRVPVGTKLAIYDLGGGTFDVAVVEKGEAGFTMLGTPLGVDHLGGSDFDELLFASTLDRLGVRDLDQDDPDVARGLMALRRECIEAKEALSTDVSTQISSLLPGAVRAIRFDRNEFEALIRPALEESVATTSRALRLAGVATDDLSAVVLVGGSSRIPLVTQLLSRELGVRVVLDTYPKNDVALGATRHALDTGPARGAAPPPQTSPEPAPAPQPTTPRPAPREPAPQEPALGRSVPKRSTPPAGETVVEQQKIDADATATVDAASRALPPHPPNEPTGRVRPSRVLTVVVIMTIALVTTAIALVVLRPDGSIPTTGPAPTSPTPIDTGSVGTPTPTRSASPTPAPPSAVLVSEDFSGKDLPAGWTPYAGRWKVVKGRLQATTDDTRSRIAFGPKRVPENYRIDATIRFVRVDNSSRWLNIGLDYHVEDDVGAVFVVRSDTKADNGLELAQRKKAKQLYVTKPIGAARTRAGGGKDHRLSIEVRGSRIDVFMDGRHEFKATNLARTGGQLGLVINRATVQFDDVTVTRRDA